MADNVLSKVDLEQMRCQRCNAGKGDEVYFVPLCHEISSVLCSYYEGMLRLECPVCRQVVLVIRVG